MTEVSTTLITNAFSVPTVKLVSSDARAFDVSIGTAKMSVTLGHLLDDVGGSDASIPLPNVTGATLENVIAFCNHHIEDGMIGLVEDMERNKGFISEWDQQFCKIELSALFELLLAANYLDIKLLLDVTCRTVAAMIKGKTPEQIRTLFHIKSDFTPAEEESVRRECEWVSDE